MRVPLPPHHAHAAPLNELYDGKHCAKASYELHGPHACGVCVAVSVTLMQYGPSNAVALHHTQAASTVIQNRTSCESSHTTDAAAEDAPTHNMAAR